MKLRNTILSKRDGAILMFLWRHKIATFQSLKTIFCPFDMVDSFYKRLWLLKRGGYVLNEKITGTSDKVWLLGRRGFEYLSANRLPGDLVTKMYKPHWQYHDLVTMAALLGNWHTTKPNNVEIVAEQELANTYIQQLPSHLKKSMEHRPDGLWIYSSGNDHRAIALEVELTAKSSPRYEKICAFYSAEAFFDNVLWIVSSKSLGLRILEASRFYKDARERLHLFIDVEDFKTNLWNSSIMNKSMAGVTMANVLRKKAMPVARQVEQNGLKVARRGVEAELKGKNQNFYLDFGLRLGIPVGYKSRTIPQKS